MLVCACSEAARRALSKDLVQHGAAGDGGGGRSRSKSGRSTEGSSGGGGGSGAAEARHGEGEGPAKRLRKVYRALVQGVMEEEEVGGYYAWCTASYTEPGTALLVLHRIEIPCT